MTCSVLFDIMNIPILKIKKSRLREINEFNQRGKDLPIVGAAT